MSLTTRLRLYYRSGCSLCEAMRTELFATQISHDFELEPIDVDDSEALVARYGHKVPVLADVTGHEICHYFLDTQALDDYFSRG